MATNEQPETIEPPKPLAPQAPKKPRDTKRILWNVLTLLVLLLTLCACCYFVAIVANPNLPLNPFPPEEPVTILVLPTATWTPLSLGANLAAGSILAFAFAMLEVSDSLILAMREPYAPITKMIYLLLGRIEPNAPAVACALGVVGMVILAASLLVASRLLGRRMGQLFRA